MHVQVIVSRKDLTNSIKLSPMNTSRGKNEEQSKKMGQFDRVAFKQSGESLFDELFEFDRKIKDTMTYANMQKNGSLYDRLQMDALKPENLIVSDTTPKEESVKHLATDLEKPYNDFSEQININITDDVDDEAVYGRNRNGYKPRGR